MVSRDRIIILVLGFGLLAWFLSAVSGIIFPFIVGVILAYFLNPVVSRLGVYGIDRGYGSMFIIIAFFALAALVSVILAPALYHQLLGLVKKAPEYVDLFNAKYYFRIEALLNELDIEISHSNISSYINSHSQEILRLSGGILNNIVTSSLLAINVLSLLFVTPIIAFYLLRDWVKLIDRVRSLLPKKYKKVIERQFVEIDRTLSAYLRGQINVCLLLGAFYAIGLTIIGLDFGLFIGLATGIFSFIPYIGMMLGVTIGLIVAFFQWGGDLSQMLIVTAIFLIGQFIEGNFVTPKLIGNKVGLHPIWIIFGLFSGAALFGFTGILLAIPVTAILGVIIKFLVGEYEKKLKNG